MFYWNILILFFFPSSWHRSSAVTCLSRASSFRQMDWVVSWWSSWSTQARRQLLWRVCSPNISTLVSSVQIWSLQKSCGFIQRQLCKSKSCFHVLFAEKRRCLLLKSHMLKVYQFAFFARTFAGWRSELNVVDINRFIGSPVGKRLENCIADTWK